jgi:hypothetical protein
MLKQLSIVVLLAAACGGSNKAPVDTTKAPVDTTATGGAQAGVQLALGEMKLIDVNKNKAILIHADGTIEVDGAKRAKITSDGKILAVDSGEVGFALQVDGSVKGADGKDVGVIVGADGAITMGETVVSLDPTGAVIGGNPKAPKMRVEGATDAGLKRTAMFVLVALSSPSAGTASGSAGTPTP